MLTLPPRPSRTADMYHRGRSQSQNKTKETNWQKLREARRIFGWTSSVAQHATSLLLVNLFVSCSVYGVADNLESVQILSERESITPTVASDLIYSFDAAIIGQGDSGDPQHCGIPDILC